MHFIPLFVTACVVGGAGGMLGSILGNAMGHTGLFVGGVIGGVAAGFLTGRVAVWRRWVPQDRFWRTALGAAAGFLAAAGVAVSTLSSPIGPVLSTLLVGAGAVLGARGPRASRS
jgi:hypothetical protein